MNASTQRRLSATLAFLAVALTACTDKGTTVDPTTTSPSPTMVHTSPSMSPSSSVASASPSPSLEPR